MDLRKLKTLIDLVSDSDIAELEITEGEGKVKIVKFSQPPEAQPQVQTIYAPVPSSAPAAQGAAAPAAQAPAPAPAPEAAATPAPAASSGFTVKSPMVGTFYRASSPTSPPYVEVGSTVKQGDVLCIIEAMKLLNEIEAEKSGVIKEIHVSNAEPVEFGQPLFVIE